jgi:2-polyprenyl-6-methoxyphenol hydroxylase-like FAD-dependent oxidoreductase
MTNKRFAIIGGGIAGLTTAIALNNIGINPEIFESAPTIKGIGAGLVLAANAIKGFQALAIADEIIQQGRLLSSFILYDEKGKEIIKTNSQEISKKYGADNFTISRAALHKLLLSKLDPARIHPGKQVFNLERSKNSVLIKFNDNTYHETDFVVAADGIHSAVRKKLLPEALPRYAGYTCWRAIIDNSNLNLTESSETWGTRGRFGIVPLTGNEIYWFACINAPGNDRKMQEMKIKDLANIFKDYHQPIPEILRGTKDENLIWNDIIDLKPTNQFAFDNIVLIGDAAHATTPNMGQGACQAVEDAVVLADELNTNSNYITAFKKFEQRRIKRTRFIVNRSWNIGKMAQTDNKILAGLRNFLFRQVPAGFNEQQIKKLYDVDF